MAKEFVECRKGSFYLAGSRVPLAHLVRLYQSGEPPEAIRMHFPTLNLEQVYGAIAFYLGNERDVNQDIAHREHEEDEFEKAHPVPPELKAKLDRARQEMPGRK